MPKKDELDWLKLVATSPTENIDWSMVEPTCTLPPKTPEEKEYLFNRDVFYFIDRWIIVRDDGTPVLNGKVADFEEALKEFVDGYRMDW